MTVVYIDIVKGILNEQAIYLNNRLVRVTPNGGTDPEWMAKLVLDIADQHTTNIHIKTHDASSTLRYGKAYTEWLEELLPKARHNDVGFRGVKATATYLDELVLM